MNKQSIIVLRHLSALIFICTYLIIALSHLFLEGFIGEIQFDLLTTLLPLVLLGVILDYIAYHNNELEQKNKIFSQIMPAGLVIMLFISFLFNRVGEELPQFYNYIYWLFLSTPFFILSYDKNTHKKKMIFTIVGLGLMVSVYLFLTTQTDNLDEGAGIIVYFITYFSMLYSASSIVKAEYISTIIGFLNGLALLILRYRPITVEEKTYGWDYNIFNNFEYIMLFTLIICILIRLVASFLNKTNKE